MKKMISVLAAGAMTLSLAACNTPGERAAGGALIGGAAGAAVGAAASGGRVGGTLAGATVGAVGGALVGAATTPQGPQCPYGYVRDAYGNVYCR